MTRIVCPACGHASSPHRVTCKGCHADLGMLLAAGASGDVASGGAWLPPAARQAVLDRAVAAYSAAGYRVVWRSETAAQLVRPKRFSLLWCLVWALVLIGWLFYVAYYLAQRDEVLYLEVLPDGRLRRTRGR